MVNWFCFKFWFCFRLLLASIAHFNWFAAIYVNCIYFTLWKSYDILWFWTHLTLCTCFPALRPENYLLVFIKLIRAKRGEHANKSYKEIYELLYKDRTDETNAERELRRIETVRRERRETRRRKNQQQQLGIGEKQKAPSENTTDSDDDDEDISVHSELLGRTALYPRLDSPSEKDVEEQAMPNIRLDRSKNRKDKPMGPGENEELVSYGNSSNTSQRGWRRLVPAFLTRTPPSAEAIQAKREAKQRDLAQKQAKKEESEQRLLEKKARRERKKRQMAELKRRARIERRRKNFADAVDLLLTYLRLITSFAIMVGNIHKTFIPRYLAPPLDNVYDSPDLLMVFTITLLIDVGFFWLLVFWSYCQQMALCCRLGFCRFLLWCTALVLLGGGLMFGPMHFVHEQLDGTWCLFEEGQPLSEYFDG